MTNPNQASSHDATPEHQGSHVGSVMMFGFECGLAILADDSHEIVARNLSFWLKQRNLRPADLARYLDLSKATVSRWMAAINSPETRTALKICKFLEIPLEELYRQDPGSRPVRMDVDPKSPDARRMKLLQDLADELGFKIRLIAKKNT